MPQQPNKNDYQERKINADVKTTYIIKIIVETGYGLKKTIDLYHDNSEITIYDWIWTLNSLSLLQ